MNSEKVIERFYEMYGKDGKLTLFHSPGRVNLIGEHTDYNGGFVFPCALDFGTYGAMRRRNDKTINFASTDFDLKVSVNLDNISYVKEHDWANYLKGIVYEFQKMGFGSKMCGIDILISGNIPNGSGLSSSASIELLTCVILNETFSCGLSMIEMVKLSQRSENTFVGVNCGIMDQFAVGMGKKGMAMFLDCMKLRHEYVDCDLKGAKLIIANTKKRRGLADSKYNERRSECDKAVEYLKKNIQINLLGDITPETFEENKSYIPDKIIRNRAEHVVYEDHRVLAAVKCLRAGDIAEFGKLMVQSHNSLRDLYEVTGLELDTMVEEALKINGTIGSRMTGAGFGGCTVSIVREDAVQNFIAKVGEGYQARTGIKADFYTAEIGDGAKKLGEF